MEEKEFLTVKEAAECLRVSPKTIYGMVKRGDLRFYSARRRLYFRRKDINALLKSSTEERIRNDRFVRP